MAKVKLTPDLQDRLIQALKAGNYIDPSCAYAGITRETFYQWLKAGQNGNARFSDFSDAVTRAMAAAEIGSVAKIKLAGEGDWRAAAWLLERRHPDRWANTQRIELMVKKQLEDALDLLQAKLPKESYEELIDALASLPNS
jgi:hypothetical protein